MTIDKPEGLSPGNTSRGRPRTTGAATCARCGRTAGRTRASWPEGKICGPCFTTATRTHGTCPDCSRCNHEGEFYRRGICARCALRDDLNDLLLTDPADPATAGRIVDLLCKAERPESIITWKRSATVQALLSSLSSGTTPLTHDGLATKCAVISGAERPSEPGTFRSYKASVLHEYPQLTISLYETLMTDSKPDWSFNAITREFPACYFRPG